MSPDPLSEDPVADDLVTSDSMFDNPVTRARLMVEAEVPPERRGPGWDRHWRELEAYAAAGTDWTLAPAPPPAPKRKRRRGSRN